MDIRANLRSRGRKTKTVELEGLGEVTVQSLNAREFSEFVASQTDGSSSNSVLGMSIVSQWGMVDEEGALLFEPDEREEMVELFSYGELNTIATAVMELSGVNVSMPSDISPLDN